MFKLTLLYYDKRTSFLASASLLFFPTYFMITSTAMLTSGVVFFSVLIAFFTVKFQKTDNQKYLMLASLTTIIGSLYKRPLVVFLGIVPLYLFLFGPNRFKKRIKDLILANTCYYPSR